MADPAPAAGAVFRAFALPGRKPRGEWNLDALSVGTRSTSALTLNDPVVAHEHCRFRAVAGGFVVEDQGSVTGTWHNGQAVEGSVLIATGDQVVIGVSRLTLEVKQEEGRAVLELVVEEAAFHYKRPKPGEFHTDADEWVRSEVRFGRIPAVRGLVWLAGLFAVAAGAWVFGTRGGERFLQPGRLDGTHAALFAEDPAEAAGAAIAGRQSFATAVQAVAHASCAVCHAGSEPGDVASCASCHAELSRRHPFYTGEPGHDGVLLDAIGRPSDGCRLCHPVGHTGLSAGESTERARARLAPDAPEGDVCTVCHTAGFGTQIETMDRVLALAGQLAESGAEPARDFREYGFDEFAHATHCGKAAIACAACHAPGSSGAGDASVDFARPGFATCAACHVQGLGEPAPPPGYDAASLAALRADLARRDLLVALDWHGRGAQCFDCHAKPATGTVPEALATVEREVAVHTYGLTRVGHVEHVPPAGSKADCRPCHGDLQSLAGGVETRRAFEHESHARTLHPSSAADAASVSADDCAACHAAQWASTTSAESVALSLAVACKECHADPDRPEPENRITEHVESTGKRTVTRFSHAAHAGAFGGGEGGAREPGGAGSEGCFACHAFESADDGAAHARPVLLPGVEDCTRCHDDHRNIAGGACSFCHPAGADRGAGSASLFRGERPSRTDWPAGFQFNHFSGRPDRGHASYMVPGGTHAAEGCGECHSLENLRQAKTVREVALPDARGRLCVECHAENRGWFHWSLPDPTAQPPTAR